MIPRISTRGHSFKGAHIYYMHDPDRAKTQDRLAFTQTYNIPFDDPDAAMRYMIDTAQDAENLKREAGIGGRGARSTKRPVLTFSLSYDPNDNPTQDEMTNDAVSFMDKVLGLKEHQAIFYGHSDTAHPHIHVMTNLVHPQTGRTHTPSWSKVKASDWAHEKSQERGIGHCPQREINKKKRERGEMVNYQEPQADQKALINMLYTQSDSGKAFASALEMNGYTLAKGDRRGFVIVDHNGKIHSLSRQLKDQRASDIKARLADLKRLPMAKDIAAKRMYYDREQVEIERQNEMLDAADAAAKEPRKKPQNRITRKQSTRHSAEQKNRLVTSYASSFDEIWAWEKWADRLRDNLKKHQATFYKRNKIVQQIKTLEKQVVTQNSILGKVSGKFTTFQEELFEQRMNLLNVDQRIEEQIEKLELEIEKNRPVVRKEELINDRPLNKAVRNHEHSIILVAQEQNTSKRIGKNHELDR